MKKKIVLYNTEGLDDKVEKAYLEKRGLSDRYEVIRLDGDKDEEFFEVAKDAEGVTIVYMDVTDEVMSRLPACKVLTIQSIGVNNIDMKAATKYGICVGNVPDYCIEEVAIHTIGLMLDCRRKITQLDRTVRQGAWNIYECGQIDRLRGMTYGLFSFGNIPRKIVELLKAWGVDFIAYDPFVGDEVFENYGVKRVDSLEELFAESDMLSVHTPLLPSTRHIIDAELLACAKPGLTLVCTGRGGVIDEDALKAALENGTLQSAAIDVIEAEDSAETVLRGLDNIIITPHVAYYSEGSLVEDREKSMMQILEVLEENKLPTYLCNKDVDGAARFQLKNPGAL